MRMLLTFSLMCAANAALACGQPVCLVNAESLNLSRIITFEDVRSSPGPGHPFTDALVLDGATFGERFAGQDIERRGDHDHVTGTATAPLTVVPGARGQNLSVVFFNGENLLNGYGAAGYPRRHAQGEGAISFLFDYDQSALSFQIRGGEDGSARAVFLARDGRVIAVLDLPPTGEHHYGFLRADGLADIAGIVITNTDPQGIAIDNLRFERSPDLS